MPKFARYYFLLCIIGALAIGVILDVVLHTTKASAYAIAAGFTVAIVVDAVRIARAKGVRRLVSGNPVFGIIVLLILAYLWTSELSSVSVRTYITAIGITILLASYLLEPGTFRFKHTWGTFDVSLMAVIATFAATQWAAVISGSRVSSIVLLIGIVVTALIYAGAMIRSARQARATAVETQDEDSAKSQD